jgi:hypothetical protein
MRYSGAKEIGAVAIGGDGIGSETGTVTAQFVA